MSVTESPTLTDKLNTDLDEVIDKLYLCKEILPTSTGIETDDTLKAIIGFLEACLNRMSALIEAGAANLLSEDLFSKCLSVHDAIIRVLDAEKVSPYQSSPSFSSRF